MSDLFDGLWPAPADDQLLQRELGAGAMATVYLAHEVRPNGKVALKVLRSKLAAMIGGERVLKEVG